MATTFPPPSFDTPWSLARLSPASWRRWFGSRLLNWTAGRAIRVGSLDLELPDGVRVVLGDGEGPPLLVRVSDPYWAFQLALNPALAVGDAYCAGGLSLEDGTLTDLVDLFGRNARERRGRRPPFIQRFWQRVRVAHNARAASRRNVAHHYDLPVEFYRRFLDPDLQYSCAFFSDPANSLEEAQREKIKRLATKLLLRPDQTVLDIGCGWGGLSLCLARDYAVRVQGVTLSTEQADVARTSASEQGLADRVDIDLADYRDLDGRYDRIISVGMFEHVGRSEFRTYFRKVAQLLKADGVAVVHTIGRAEGPGTTQPWIARRIFPGGYIPALSEMAAAAEVAGLIITDVEVLRLHYARTLRAWRDRFEATRAESARLYGEHFCKTWEFYLAVSEAAFRWFDHSVFQIQLTRRIDAVPIVRDYMAPALSGWSPAPAASPAHPSD